MKKIIPVLLCIIFSGSAFAANETEFVTSHDEGAVIINGKVVSYLKCIKKDATPAEKQKALNLIKKAKQHGVNVHVPEELPECSE